MTPERLYAIIFNVAAMGFVAALTWTVFTIGLATPVAWSIVFALWTAVTGIAARNL